jgi:4-hydroxythreonine-4-phosphate dehydrogenase
MERPIVAITMGDPAGVGPEVIVKALSGPELYETCRPLVVGVEQGLRRVVQLLEMSVELNEVNAPEEGRYTPGYIDFVEVGTDISRVKYGEIDASAGHASWQSILKALELCQDGQTQAMATAPINKEATKLAGYSDIGHLELLARLTNSSEYATMLMAGPMRTVHLTTHHSLAAACELVTKERVLARLRLIQECFADWGVEKPRIGVCALNPHAGEGGLFGREEIEQISPAVAQAKVEDIDARGPFPSDSIFNRAMAGEFDVLLALYHDQGHIPIKVYGFERSVSVALGLPFIRTSVDHGTAFDIAGKGLANPLGMANSIRVATTLARRGGLIEV